MIYIIAPILGAVLYRLRGGWFSQLTGLKQKTQIMRLIWSAPTAAFMTYAIDAPWWFALVLTVTVFTAQALFGTGQYLQDVPPRYPDWLGLARNSLAAVPVILYSGPLFIAYAVLGSCHALLYWLGFRIGKSADYGDVLLGGLSWALIAVCIK